MSSRYGKSSSWLRTLGPIGPAGDRGLVQHLLIIGAPRSGTSLLCWLTGAQDGIAMSFEVKSRAWRRVVGHDVVGVKLCIPNQIALHRPSRLVKALMRAEKNALRPVHRVVGPRVRRPPRGQSEMSIVDFLQLDSAVVVAIFRDPHEVIPSIQRRGAQPLHEAKRQYRTAIEMIHAAWKEYPSSVLLVDFCYLVVEPDKVIGPICARLRQSFDPSRVSGYTHNYGHAKLDASKAARRTTAERLDHQVFKDNPATLAKYAELIDAAPMTLNQRS